MTKKPLVALLAGLFAAAPALGQSNDWLIQGAGTLGPIYDRTNSTTDKSKFEQYQDLGNGVLSDVFVRGRSGQMWFDGYGENFGRDDEYLMLRGGTYELFKFKIWHDSLPHEFLFNGKTPFTGSGSNNLSATFPKPDPSTWNALDLGYKRTDDGGYFEWQGLAPWYIRVDANQVKFDGTKVGSGALGKSPGNGFMDLAIPVQYNTKNASVEGGYNTGAMNLSLSYLYSKFNNDFDTLTWNNPFFANNVDTTFLPPDNHYERITANATFRGLPLQSTLAARYTWSEGKSDADLAQTALNGSSPNFYGPTLPNVNHFTGKIDNQTFTIALASHPISNVDTRLYYDYYKRNNDSTNVIYAANSIVNCGGPCQSDLFHFKKNIAGLDAYWRFAPGNKLGAGWGYVNLTENRVDYDVVNTNSFFVEWKNTQVENLSARLKYIYLQRRSTYLGYTEGVDANDPNYLKRFTSAFDSSPVDRNQLKLTADWNPTPMLSFSLEGNWYKNNYQGIILGRTSDKREEIYLSGTYGAVTGTRFTAFGDYEHITYDSSHRNIGAGDCSATPPGPGCFDPYAAPNTVAYNWSANNKDKNWVIGLGLDWPVTERLLIKGSVLYYETDGSANTVTQNNYGNPLPINAYDDTRNTSVNLKGIWTYDKNWSFTLGYAYERWRYSDAGYNGYQYTIPYPAISTSPPSSYLNGYNAFTNYNANIVYVLATYKFDNTIGR